MKISKLFHWLYAVLMLLPVLVFIPTAFYYGFNEHAVAQEKTEQVPYYYETNNVESINDIIEGNVYTFNINLNTATYNNVRVLCEKIFIYNADNVIYRNNDVYATPPYFYCYVDTFNNNNLEVILNQYLDNVSANYTLTGEITINFVYKSHIGDLSAIIPYLSRCDVQYIKDYHPLTTNMSITDSMSYAWDSVWQNDLFSWSYDSFLTQPFLYITNLFNVPATNTLLYCLSYWLNISIIWLVFDLIMYVPLLVHRWIDKGIVE